MPDILEVVLEDDRWNEVDLADLGKRAFQAVLATCGLEGEGYDATLLGCNDQRIAVLNQEFRTKAKPTNVLSWPAFDLSPDTAGQEPYQPSKPDGSGFYNSLGDIAVSFDTCLKEAREQGVALTDHAVHLVVHGCLHLLGYDHETDADAARMEGLEIKILVTLGVANPY